MAVKLAKESADAIARGEPVTMAVKRASVKQLSALTVFACSKGGFPTLNRHLHRDELGSLGWANLEFLVGEFRDNGERALASALDALVGSLHHVQKFTQSGRECMQALSLLPPLYFGLPSLNE